MARITNRYLDKLVGRFARLAERISKSVDIISRLRSDNPSFLKALARLFSIIKEIEVSPISRRDLPSLSSTLQLSKDRKVNFGFSIIKSATIKETSMFPRSPNIQFSFPV